MDFLGYLWKPPLDHPTGRIKTMSNAPLLPEATPALFYTAGGRIHCVQCQAMSKRTKVQCRAPATKGKTKCKFHGGVTFLFSAKTLPYLDERKLVVFGWNSTRLNTILPLIYPSNGSPDETLVLARTVWGDPTGPMGIAQSIVSAV